MLLIVDRSIVAFSGAALLTCIKEKARSCGACAPAGAYPPHRNPIVVVRYGEGVYCSTSISPSAPDVRYGCDAFEHRPI